MHSLKRPPGVWDKWLWLIAAACWIGFFALTLAYPSSNAEPGVVTQVASVTIGLSILCALLMLGERPLWTLAARWSMLVGGVALVLGPYYLQIKEPMIQALSGLGLILVALPVGYWIGNHMERVTHLVPLAVAMSMADIYSVFLGLTARVAKDVTQYQQQQIEAAQVAAATAPPGQEMEAAQQAMASLKAPLADYIIAHFPIAGSGMTIPVLGIGDFLVLGFIFRAALVHNISPRVVFTAGLLSTIAALVASWLLAQYGPPLFDHGIAALPFIALGTVGYLWLTEPRMRRLDRQERMLTLVVVVLFAALTLVQALSRVRT